MENDFSEGLLTITEAGKFLRCSQSQVYVLLGQHAFGSVRLAGRSRRIAKADLIRYCERLAREQRVDFPPQVA